MLTDDVVRQLANGEGSVYHFDLSKISSEFYEPLLKTLQYFAIKKVDSLGFTCDELAHAQQRAVTGKQMPIAVLNSIAKTKSSYMRNVVELLCHVLPRSTRLVEITLSNLTIRKDHWLRVVSALARSTTLESINLSKCRIGVEGTKVLLKELDPNQIRALTITYCGVSEENLPDILDFIGRKDPNIAHEGGIQLLKVSRAEISDEGQKRIRAALGQPETPIKKLSPQKGSPRKASPHRSPVRRASPVREAAPMTKEKREIAELKALEKENRELKEELARIRKEIDAVEYNENVYIVGKGAEEFVAFISNIEQRIERLQAMKTSNRRF